MNISYARMICFVIHDDDNDNDNELFLHSRLCTLVSMKARNTSSNYSINKNHLKKGRSKDFSKDAQSFCYCAFILFIELFLHFSSFDVTLAS